MNEGDCDSLSLVRWNRSGLKPFKYVGVDYCASIVVVQVSKDVIVYSTAELVLISDSSLHAVMCQPSHVPQFT